MTGSWLVIIYDAVPAVGLKTGLLEALKKALTSVTQVLTMIRAERPVKPRV